jgi:hypothetical protein
VPWYLRLDHQLRDTLPCATCPRPAQAALARLPNRSLGQVERRMLLLAREPERGPFYLWTAVGLRERWRSWGLAGVPTAAERESGRRAVHTLRQIGLLAWPDIGPRRHEGRLTVQRSPLGQAVVDVCRAELEGGQPRVLAHSHAQPISALVREILIAYI